MGHDLQQTAQLHPACKALLKQNGRAAVVVPDNVLFEGGAGETVRRKLLHECDVHTLLRLPTGLFYAQGVKANVLFFDKKPASETPWTKKLWIYDLRTNMHFTLKTSSLQRSDLDEFVKNYNPENRHQRRATYKEKTSPLPQPHENSPSPLRPLPSRERIRGEGASLSGEGVGNEGRWRSYNYDELVSRDKASLDIFWLKDESLEASDNLLDLSSLQQKIPAVTKNNFHDSQFVVLSVTSDMLYSNFTPRKRFRYFQDTCPEPGAAQ